ncbi:MAG: exonuclease domain-containing protein [Lachnospiraceae bacterium]|jgi:inhibitor of KinA sporulation pathway (predicted exonuclease)|nr:exonuclease domain-containing protein [Lachnospiraceae bacterium]
MNYIILDLEWNQPSEGRICRVKEIPFEIIEIGAIKMDENYNVIGEFNEMIRPKIYRDMNRVTQNLLHINMEDLERGKPFEEVIEKFLRWCGEDYIFGTWGPLDLTELQRNMRYYGKKMFCDRPLEYLDLQKIFAISFEEKNARHTLEYAVDFLGIEKDIPFHRAFSDAYYTSKVFEKCPKDKLAYVSFDTFVLPPNKAKEIHIQFPDYSKYISRTFKSKEAAIGDREVMSTKCYLCKKPTRRKLKWFTANGKHYYSISICEKHGYIKGKVRLKKTEAGLYYVAKTMRQISEEQVEEIVRKKEQAKKQYFIQKNDENR